MDSMTNTTNTPGHIQIGAGLHGKVHYEASGQGGEAATLCGRGAEKIVPMPGRSVDCKACLKAQEKAVQAVADAEVVARGLERNARQAARSRRGEAAPAEKSTARESRYVADHETRMLLATRAMSIGYTTEGAATLMENAYWVPAYPAPCGDECDTHQGMRRYDNGECEACEVERQAAEREHSERIASDGAVIRVGSRVVVLADWTEDGVSLPGMVTFLDSSAVWVEHAEGCAPLAYGAEMLATVHGCECGTLKCHGDGPCATPGTVVNTAAGGRLVGYMCQGCQDRLDVAIPPTAPKTEPQRRALRLLGELEKSGAQPQVNGGTLKTLVRDGWVTIDTRPVRSVITLTADARAWLDSEHTAEVTTHVHGGVTLYGATCNCGPGHENSRMARRVPWTSAMLTSAEDAVAVALGHGEVSRPRHASAEGAQSAADALLTAAEALAAHPMRGSRSTPARDAAMAAYRDAGASLRTAVVAAYPDVDAEAVITAWSMGDAPIADAVAVVRRSMPEISVADARITAEGTIIKAESTVHCPCGADDHIADNCPDGVTAERRGVACGECGIMPHSMECLTGLRLESPTPQVDETVAAMVAGEWTYRGPMPTVDDVAAMTGDPIGWVDGMWTGEPRTFHEDELAREHAYWETLKVAASLTAEEAAEVAGLRPVESVVAAHNAGVAWSAKGGKRKASSVPVKRSQQRAGMR